MRMSTLFGLTLREAPSGVEVASYELLLRAWYIRQLAAGIFSYLPLAKRSIGKIENILREEMDAAGGQEVSMSVVQPADVWERSGRYQYDGTGAGQAQRPQEQGDGSGDDPRGDRRRPCCERGGLLPAATQARVPDPDQVPRRPAAKGGPDPGSRVHYEGRIQPRQG